MDKKFAAIATIILGALGVLVPVGLWFSDLDSRLIEVNIISKVNLDPTIPSGLDGEVAVTLDGRNVARPHFVVVEVVNGGNRSISSSDVETPITLKVGRASIVRAQVMKAIPGSLDPQVQVADGGVSVKPLLLNPGDRFQVGMLTSGEDPVVSANARISGVKDLRVEDPLDSREKLRRWKQVTLAFLMLSVYFTLMMQGFGRWVPSLSDLRVRNGAMIPMALICAFTSAFIGAEIFTEYKSHWTGLIGFTLFALTAFGVGGLTLMRRRI